MVGSQTEEFGRFDGVLFFRPYHAATDYAGAGVVLYEGYGVAFCDAVNRRFEQTTSVVTGLLVTAVFAALLW